VTPLRQISSPDTPQLAAGYFTFPFEADNILIRSAETILGIEYISLIFLKRPWLRAVRQAVAATGAFAFDDFVHVVDVLHFRMDGAFWADFAAQAAGDAESFDDSDFHASAHLTRCRPTRGSVPVPTGEAENRKLLRWAFDLRA
jgi:hypothetical protein